MHISGYCYNTGCHGDCTVLCDTVALESKFPVDIIIHACMYVPLLMSLQEGPHENSGTILTCDNLSVCVSVCLHAESSHIISTCKFKRI